MQVDDIKDADKLGFDENWALVELYRWEYGQLPPSCSDDAEEADKEPEKVHLKIALNSMADCLAGNDHDKWPKPFNVASVLRYVARRVKDE
jgi:hypothetical protein